MRSPNVFGTRSMACPRKGRHGVCAPGVHEGGEQGRKTSPHGVERRAHEATGDLRALGKMELYQSYRFAIAPMMDWTESAVGSTICWAHVQILHTSVRLFFRFRSCPEAALQFHDVRSATPRSTRQCVSRRDAGGARRARRFAGIP